MPHSSALCIPPRSCLCPSPLNGASSSGKQVGEERTKRQEVDTASHVCPGSIQDRAQLYNPSKDCWCEGARRRVLGKQFTKDPSPVSSGWHAPSPPSSFPRFVSPLSAPLSFRLTPTLSFIAAFSPLGFKDLTHPSVLASDSPPAPILFSVCSALLCFAFPSVFLFPSHSTFLLSPLPQP